MEAGEVIETDGVTSLDIVQTDGPGIDNATGSERKLQPGFGFTSSTIHSRLLSENQKVKSTVKKKENVEQEAGVQDNNMNAAKKNDQGVEFSCDFNNILDLSDCTDNACLSSGVVEIDTILIKQCKEKVLSNPPGAVSEDYADISAEQLPMEGTRIWMCMIPVGKKKPDRTSAILIPHSNADNPKEGDYFGAKLCTFKDRRKDGSRYYRHFFVDVEINGPADQMRIANNDELVLINEVFVPELSHDEVLALFRAVKVDAKTRLSLVIRRVRDEKWEWIETSAILAPDREIDDHPVIERVEFKELRGEKIEVPKSRHLYKVPGTQKYLDICDGKVSIDEMNRDESDRTKILWKRARYWQDDGDAIHINFAAALCDEAMEWYIGVDQDKIVLKREPEWFKMIKAADRIRFQFDKKYLGYNLKTGEVKAEISQCVFAELPAPVMNNERPSSPAEFFVSEHAEEGPEASSADKLAHGSLASSLTSIRSDGKSVTSSQTSVDSDRPSTASSQTSVDSDKRSIASSQTSVESDRKSIASSQTSVDSDRPSTASSQTSVDSDRRSIASSQTSVDSDRSSVLSSQVSTDSGANFTELNHNLDNVTDIHGDFSSLSLSQTSGTSGYRSDNHVDEDFDIIKQRDTLLDGLKDKCEKNDINSVSSS